VPQTDEQDDAELQNWIPMQAHGKDLPWLFDAAKDNLRLKGAQFKISGGQCLP